MQDPKHLEKLTAVRAKVKELENADLARNTIYNELLTMLQEARDMGLQVHIQSGSGSITKTTITNRPLAEVRYE